MCLTLHLSTSQTHVTQLHLNPHPLYALLMSPLPSYILHFPSSLAYFDHYHICNQPFVLPPPTHRSCLLTTLLSPPTPLFFLQGALLLASKYGQTEIAKALLTAPGINVNHVDSIIQAYGPPVRSNPKDEVMM